jgi:hypothetical protein
MSNFVFNCALGRIVEKVADGATLKMLVLKVANTDATLKDLDTVAAVLASGSTAEANFTNYARKTLAGVAATVNDSTDSVKVDCDDVTFTAAGGATNNTTTDVLIYEEVAGGDANCIPLVLLDAVFTTDGNDVTLQINANGFFGAS